MNEFEKAKESAVEAGEHAQKGLVKVEQSAEEKAQDYAADLKAQAQEYGQKVQDAAGKAKDYATEKYNLANDKFQELKSKDPQELVEEAKTYAKQKPGQAILISAAVGLALGLILRGRK
jgi:ElaB/YqjD/DUF883 family membrane-anchored ribosome-binding protein